MNTCNLSKAKTAVFFAFPERSVAYRYIADFEYPWEAIAHISEFILDIGKSLPESKYTKYGEDVWIANSASVAPSAVINGPCIIGVGADIRHSAFVRGCAVIGNSAVVGNSCEIKNSILFDEVQIPHYNYVGDSILGYKSHMGAGAITSNVKSDKKNVVISFDDAKIETGMKKLGALVGDYVEIGCNSVLNPGTVIFGYSNVYPLSSVRGVVPASSIYKNKNDIVLKKNE